MSSVIRTHALAALCGIAIIGFGQSAQAATWDIDGGVAPFSAASYGPALNQNNVVNNPVAQVFDTLNGASIVAAANLNASFTNRYDVSWTYLGSESGHTINFSAPGVIAGGFPETNANNNCTSSFCLHLPGGNSGPIPMGTATNQNALTPAFSFLDTVDLSTVANGSNNTDVPPAIGAGPANFLMSYAVLLAAGDPGATFGAGWYLTSDVSDFVVIGLNDSGFRDDNHDDFTLVAFIRETPFENTPIPGALPLFASVLGGGFLFRRLRNRRQAKAAI